MELQFFLEIVGSDVTVNGLLEGIPLNSIDRCLVEVVFNHVLFN